MAGERDLFGPVGEGKRGLGDVGIGDVFLVLVLIVACDEEPRLGMMNRWGRRYALKVRMTSCKE